MNYKTGKRCPDCGVEEEEEEEEWNVTFTGTSRCVADSSISYSCDHYERRSKESPCRYCGKKNSPVRQVPAPVPVSECYCDDCAERCRDEYSTV